MDHLKGNNTLVSYVYLNSILTATKLNPTNQYFEGAAKKKIESVSIFGLERAPVAVRNLVSDINLEDTQLSYTEGTLVIIGLDFAVDDGLIQDVSLPLLHFYFV